MRYLQLLDAVREKQPRAILEVGTWNGGRAQDMLRLAPDAVYYGFDLFEDATRETDYEEMNVKPHHYLSAVEDRLTGYDVHLFKGNTRETLAAFNEKVDFVWLDGGHSVETIRSDWENIKRCLTDDAWVFFDDYYTGPEIDTKRFGCNEIIRGMKHDVLPDKDYVRGGGYVQMVRVYP
jgi:predicted O-methyltransferase YrrM